LVKISEYCTGIVEECATSVRQHHAARLAAKQLHIELVLSRLDLAAEGRLLDAKSFSRPRYVTFLSDRNEVAELPQLHSHTSEV